MGEVNLNGWLYLLEGDLAWVMNQPRTLERDHVIAILQGHIESAKKHGPYWRDGLFERTADLRLQAENEELRAHNDRLRLGLYEVHAMADAKDSHDEIVAVCRAWLDEQTQQSLAEIRAQELERAAAEMQGLKWRQNFTPADWLRQRAARIRSEAKE